jgi:hypothetical protein
MYAIHPCENHVHTLFSSVKITYTPIFEENKNIMYFWAGFTGFPSLKPPISRTQWNVTISTSLEWYISTYMGVDERRHPWCKNILSIWKLPYSLNLLVVSLDLEIYFPVSLPLSYMIVGCVPIHFGSCEEVIHC